MKKWFIGLLVIIVLIVTGTYIFIPGKLIFSKVVLIKCTANGVNRYFTDETRWKKWWPGYDSDNGSDKNVFTYEGYTYHINKQLFSGAEITTTNDVSKMTSTVVIIPVQIDSVRMTWQSSISTGLNPIQRMLQYREAKKIDNNVDDILKRLKSFLEKKENIYGINIQQIKVTDTLLVAIKSVFKNYPTVKDIYSFIKSLRKYIASQNAKETNHPMLHVEATDSTHYKTIVAIPVDKKLTGKGNILFKRMVPGNILVTGNIKGGSYSISHAFAQLKNYVEDYKKESPAVPFESLITDRSSEPDTTKWVTKIYYPIF